MKVLETAVEKTEVQEEKVCSCHDNIKYVALPTTSW